MAEISISDNLDVIPFCWNPDINPLETTLSFNTYHFEENEDHNGFTKYFLVTCQTICDTSCRV